MSKATDKEEICGKCLHHRYEDGEWICTNPDSICYGCYTEYYDGDDCFEERAAKNSFSVEVKSRKNRDKMR